MTFEALAPMLISYIMVAVVITNTTVIVEAIIGIASHAIEQVASIVAHGGAKYDTISGLKGSGFIGRMIVGFSPSSLACSDSKCCHGQSFGIYSIYSTLPYDPICPSYDSNI